MFKFLSKLGLNRKNVTLLVSVAAIALFLAICFCNGSNAVVVPTTTDFPTTTDLVENYYGVGDAIAYEPLKPPTQGPFLANNGAVTSEGPIVEKFASGLGGTMGYEFLPEVGESQWTNFLTKSAQVDLTKDIYPYDKKDLDMGEVDSELATVEAFTKESDIKDAIWNRNDIVTSNSEWQKTRDGMNPANRLRTVIKDFGVPSEFDGSKGGKAVWDRPALKQHQRCFERIELRDEMIPHGDHFDFLYAWMKLDVPNDINVESLSGGIEYDAEKRVVCVRCHFMGAIVSTLWLLMQVAQGNLSMKDAKNMHKSLVESTLPTSEKYDSMARRSMELELCKYVAYEELKGQPQMRCSTMLGFKNDYLA